MPRVIPSGSFGDCLAHGERMAEKLPLMFKGDDFAKTDITVLGY
jgi:uncharacterized protein with PIN domain